MRISTRLKGGAERATAGVVSQQAAAPTNANAIIFTVLRINPPLKAGRSMRYLPAGQNIADDRSHWPTLLV
ncbi:dTDP-4-dehydrorhamnose reductase [Pseudomonas sp. Os17]|nr:dTDP-4-dehydrorhamnose reductase [Pseudomonas sp. Os17]